MTDSARPDAAMAAMPPCPITGKPPRRRIQKVSLRALADIWRYGQGVDIRPLLRGVPEMGLYESATGLVYFHPPVVGDANFYQTYYKRPEIHASLTEGAMTRKDFARAASHVQPGAKVVDVGCGPALFRHHVPQAVYTGLDPYAEDVPGISIVHDTLDGHAARHPGAYDVATAFHVIEHVTHPLEHAAKMAQLVRPGGLVILATPLHPSIWTEVPNLPLNLPPHHVTWWNPEAFKALAHEVGLEVVEAVGLPPSPHHAPILWLHRLLTVKTRKAPDERYVANRVSWHLSIGLAYLASRLARAVMAPPKSERPIEVILVARKPL